MTTGKRKPSGGKRDFMEVARGGVEQAIGERMDGTPLEKPVDRRNPRAVALGSGAIGAFSFQRSGKGFMDSALRTWLQAKKRTSKNKHTK